MTFYLIIFKFILKLINPNAVLNVYNIKTIANIVYSAIIEFIDVFSGSMF